jgi:hypothetical protein
MEDGQPNAFLIDGEAFAQCGGVMRGVSTIWYLSARTNELFYEGEDPSHDSDGMTVVNKSWWCEPIPEGQRTPFGSPEEAQELCTWAEAKALELYGECAWDDSGEGRLYGSKEGQNTEEF